MTRFHDMEAEVKVKTTSKGVAHPRMNRDMMRAEDRETWGRVTSSKDFVIIHHTTALVAALQRLSSLAQH